MNAYSNSTFGFRRFFSKIRPAVVLALIIVTALLAFEMFNYSTTEYALSDLLGKNQFLGLRWATILAIAFCGIDFAGIARLFTPERGSNEPKAVWYLFGAWFLAATMNANFDLVGCINGGSQPQFAEQRIFRCKNPNNNCAGFCGFNGLGNSHSNHWNDLGCRRPFLMGKWTGLWWS